MRAACAWVAGRARSVRIEEVAIAAYAAELEEEAARPAPDDDAPDPAGDLAGAGREQHAAYVICLNAINFGSGWWPTIRKRPGHRLPPASLDALLWNRGRGARYKALPRPRCRTTAY